jgi:RNA polymerase sigma-70 factor (ECF subfamily)
LNADPDAPLIERIARGDGLAVRLLVARKLPRTLALAARLLGDRSEAEDVAQEAFLRVWKHAGRWQPGPAKFDSWLHLVTINLCRDRLRRRREVPTDQPPDQADPAPGADGLLIERQRHRSVAAAVAALPERQREAIVLVHYQDMSNIEAAAILDVSVEALESLLARGRRTLRQALRPQEDANE